jgi:hypothetical protein
MTEKLHKVAKYFQEKYSEERNSYYADIDWLQNLAGQMWQKRSDMEAAAQTQENAFRVLRYLQSLLTVSRHLVQTAKTTGMSESSAKQYKNALMIALHGLAGVPGLEAYNEWFQAYNNSISDFHPRPFFPRKSHAQPKPVSGEGSGKPAKEKEEEDLPLPPGLLPGDGPKMVPFPLGAIVDPTDPEGKSAY